VIANIVNFKVMEIFMENTEALKNLTALTEVENIPITQCLFSLKHGKRFHEMHGYFYCHVMLCSTTVGKIFP
jgi:hypothetical protein